MDDHILAPERYPESFVLVSGMGGHERGTWKMMRDPDGRLGGQGHPVQYG